MGQRLHWIIGGDVNLVKSRGSDKISSFILFVFMSNEQLIAVLGVAYRALGVLGPRSPAPGLVSGDPAFGRLASNACPDDQSYMYKSNL